MALKKERYPQLSIIGGELLRNIRLDWMLDSVHPETGDFRMLSDFEPRSSCSDPRQIRHPGVVGNRNSVD